MRLMKCGNMPNSNYLKFCFISCSVHALVLDTKNKFLLLVRFYWKNTKFSNMDSFKNELAALAGIGGMLGAGMLCTKLLFLGQRPKPHGIPVLVCWGVASVGVVVASAWFLNRRQRIEDSTEDSKDEDPTTSLQDIKRTEISILDKVMPMLDQIRFKQDENYKKAESTESRGNDIMTALKEITAMSERSNAALKNVEAILKRRSESIARRSTESD